MKKNTIYYLATKTDVVDTFKSHYGPQGYAFEELPHQEQLPDDLLALLLIEPLRVKGQYLAVNRIWKNYLFKHRPDVKLLVATHAQSKHTNLFSLLDFPRELAGFLDAAKTVSEYSFGHHTEEKKGATEDKYLDTWLISLPHSGRLAIAEMQRFLDGHDRINGFAEQLFRMRSLVMNELHADGSIAPENANQLENELNYLRQRWIYYEWLFPYLPFTITMAMIGTRMNTIKGLLNQQHLPLKELEAELTAIYKLTQDEIHPIVFPEEYW